MLATTTAEGDRRSSEGRLIKVLTNDDKEDDDIECDDIEDDDQEDDDVHQ